MNKTAFFTVFAGAIFAIALTGCPSEAEEPVVGGGGEYIGVSSDVDGINAAFASTDPVINKVYLIKDLEIKSGETLVIPSGKTLSLTSGSGDYKIFTTTDGVIVASDANAIDFGGWNESSSGKAINMGDKGMLIAAQAFIDRLGESSIKNLVSINTNNKITAGIGESEPKDGKFATVLPDGDNGDNFDIKSIPTGVKNYYVINSKPDKPIILEFTAKESLEKITVTSSVEIKNIPGGFDGSLIVMGDISNHADASSTGLTIGCEVSAQAAKFNKKVIFNKNVTLKGLLNTFSEVEFKGGGTISDPTSPDDSTTFNGPVTISGNGTTTLSIDNAVFNGEVTVNNAILLIDLDYGTDHVLFRGPVAVSGTAGSMSINDADFIKGPVTLRGGTISGNREVTGNVTVSSTGEASINAVFNGDVTVSGTDPVSIKSDSINGDVTIENFGSLALDVTEFSNNKTANVGSGATLNLKATNTPQANINIAKDGNVSYTGSVFTLDGARTVGAASVSLVLDSTGLSVKSAGGTLDLTKSSITLTGGNNFMLGGSTAVIFGAGSIGADSYQVKGAGTLFSSLSATTFKENEIAGATSSPVLTFGNDTGIEIQPGNAGTLSNINVDLTNAGRITFGKAGMLYLAGGGSITTGVSDENLAYGGVIVAGSLNITGGSLLVGSLSEGGTYAASILAGSIGTSSSNFIAKGGSFVHVNYEGGSELSGYTAQTDIPAGSYALDGGSASLGGSILIFSN
jgi:hypothetical protein